MKLIERTLETLPLPDGRSQIIYYDLEGRGNVRGLGFRITATARSWTLDYTDAAGKRRRATLARYPDLSLEQARHKASEFHTAMAKGAAGPLEAKRAAREAARVELIQRQRDKTMAELAELWMESHAKLHKRASSISNDRSALQLHILPRLGSMQVAEVTKKDVKALHANLASIPIQANRVHGLLTTLMRFAVEQEMRIDNPCTGIKRYPENKRIVHCTKAQLNRLYEVLEAQSDRGSANAIKLLVWTGARKNEVLKARWSEFDFEHGFWNKPAAHSKTRKGSTIPLNTGALNLLREMHAAKGGELVFPSRADPMKPMRKLERFWGIVCKEAGLANLPQPWHIHDLRHVFASMALEAGVPLLTIAPLLGHSTTAMTARYAHISDKALREATNAAGRLLAASGADDKASA